MYKLDREVRERNLHSVTNKNTSEIILPLILEEAFRELIVGCVDVLPSGQLRKQLLSSHEKNKPLTVKAGFDPTADDLHLGHTVLINKLRVFQELGHHVKFLIGDYTALIGDPTGKQTTRPQLTSEEISKHANTYQKQVFKILDKNKTTIVYNSKWLNKMSLAELISLLSHYTVAQLLERDDFFKRYQGGNPISMVEFLYPLLQGYDSVMMKSDVELGGTDQKFNLLVGRELQVAYGQSPQCILTLPLLVGLDGSKKMSKSLNNYIAIEEAPHDFYGKIMSLSDELMFSYYLLISSLSNQEVNEVRQKVNEGILHPKEAKSQLALHLITRFYDLDIAKAIKIEWDQIHQPKDRKIPKNIPEYLIYIHESSFKEAGIINALKTSNMVTSTSEARRLVSSGGIHYIQESGTSVSIKDTNYILQPGQHTFRIGKKRFIRFIVQDIPAQHQK